MLTFGLESLLQWGQSTVVVEAFGSYVDGVSTDRGENHSFLAGGHIGFFTFLTEGHAARWNPRRGGLRSARTPDALHDPPPTAGAVEAAARLTWVNLDNGAIDGGQSIDLEAGLNFYVQPTTRFMLHWLGAQIDAPGGGSAFGHAILARIQIQL